MKKLMKCRKLTAFIMALVLSAITFAVPFKAYADPTPTPYDVNSAFSSEGKMFEKTENVVKEAGGSLKSLITTVAVIILVVAVIFTGMQFTSKNSAKRQEAKSNLAAIIIGAVLIFGAVAVITLSGTIANALNSSISAP